MMKSDFVGFEQMREAVFNALQVAPREIERGFGRMGLCFPLQISAARFPRNGSKVPAGPQHGKYFWHLHPGTIYILWPPENTTPLSIRRGWVYGEAVRCETAAGLINCLQNAAVSLRRKELASFSRNAALALSLSDELDARRLALRRIRESLERQSLRHPSHWQDALEAWMGTVMHRYHRQINGVQKRMMEFLCLLVCDLDSPHSLSRTYRRLQQEILQFYSFDEVRHRFPDMVRELLREVPLHHAWQQSELSPITRRALAWIEEQAHRPVTVAQCAAAIPVSSAYLCRLLQRETGLSPIEHLRYQRIALAKNLLEEGRQSIEDIAKRSGFGSAEHFHRVFRHQTGMTPTAYRRNAYK